jgi:hypothetical protein
MATIIRAVCRSIRCPNSYNLFGVGLNPKKTHCDGPELGGPHGIRPQEINFLVLEHHPVPQLPGRWRQALRKPIAQGHPPQI